MSKSYSGSWRSCSPWVGAVSDRRIGGSGDEAGLCVMLRDRLSLATIISRKGKETKLAEILTGLAGVCLPATPKIVHGRKMDLVWSGHSQWLLVSEQAGSVSQVAQELSEFAAVSDQSDARAVLRVSGDNVRDVLAKGCMIDLHPRVFQAGDTALTSIAHIGVQIWQLDDVPTYEIAVARSMAGSFWSWMQASTAEFGLSVL